VRTRRIPRLTSLLAALVLVAGLVPASALAAPNEESCSASRAVPFSTPVPADMRTSGVHRFEWYSTWTNADGSVGEGTSRNQILIDAAAPVYPNTVLLRIFRNTTLLADGSVVDVDAIRPDQQAQLYAAAYSLKADTLFLSSFRTWLRYETSKNHWTPFVELARGPETNFCNQVTTSAWKKAYGWD
jgi:hypothetical protein